MAITGLITVNKKQFLEVDSDPSVNATPAPIGSMAMFDDGGAGKSYLKTGALDTDWKLGFQDIPADSFWQIDGNDLTAPALFGSVTGNHDITFERNSVEHMRMTENGGVQFSQDISIQDGNLFRLNGPLGDFRIFHDPNGVDTGVPSYSLEADANAALLLAKENSALAMQTNSMRYVSGSHRMDFSTDSVFLLEDNEKVMIKIFSAGAELSYGVENQDYLETADATATVFPLNQSISDEDGLQLTEIYITAQDAAGNAACFKKSVLIKCVAGVHSIVQSLEQDDFTVIEPALDGIDAQVVIGVGGDPAVEVTGLATTNIKWSLSLEGKGLESVTP